MVFRRRSARVLALVTALVSLLAATSPGTWSPLTGAYAQVTPSVLQSMTSMQQLMQQNGIPSTTRMVVMLGYMQVNNIDTQPLTQFMQQRALNPNDVTVAQLSQQVMQYQMVGTTTSPTNNLNTGATGASVSGNAALQMMRDMSALSNMMSTSQLNPDVSMFQALNTLRTSNPDSAASLQSVLLANNYPASSTTVASFMSQAQQRMWTTAMSANGTLNNNNNSFLNNNNNFNLDNNRPTLVATATALLRGQVQTTKMSTFLKTLRDQGQLDIVTALEGLLASSSLRASSASVATVLEILAAMPQSTTNGRITPSQQALQSLVQGATDIASLTVPDVIESLSSLNMYTDMLKETMEARERMESSSSSSSTQMTAAEKAATLGGLGITRRTSLTIPIEHSQNVPRRSMTATDNGAGTATLVIDPNARVLEYNIVHDVANANGVHIHTGFRGANGDVAFALCNDVASCRSPISGTINAVTNAQMATIESMGWYFNVHSAQWPDGATRGQLVLPASLGLSSSSSSMNNMDIDPAMLTPEMQSMLSNIVDQLNTYSQLLFVGAVHDDMSNSNMLNGQSSSSMNMPNTMNAMNALNNLNAMNTMSTNKQPPPVLTTQSLMQHLSVVTDGLLAQSHTVLMTSTQEVPPVPVEENEPNAKCVFTVDVDNAVLHYSLTHLHKSKVTGIHIHTGTPTTTGQVAHVLCSSPQSCVSPVMGTVPFDSLAARQLRVQGWYVNLHTREFPQGAVRGNLVFPRGMESLLTLYEQVWELPLTVPLTGAAEVPPVPEPTSQIEAVGQAFGQGFGTGLGGQQAVGFNQFGLPIDAFGNVVTQQQTLNTQNMFGGMQSMMQMPATALMLRHRVNEANVQYDLATQTFHYVVRHSVQDASAAHIHVGLAGANGDVAFTLCNDSTSCRSPIRGSIGVSQAAYARVAQTGWYVNVHSTSRPNGAVRGQVETQPMLRHVVMKALMGLLDQSLQAAGFVGADPARTMQMMSMMGMSGMMMGMMGMSTAVPIANTDASMAADNSAVYVSLSGLNQVPAAQQFGQMSTESGTGVITFNDQTQQATLQLTHNVQDVTAVHIHQGRKGAAGGVLVTVCASAQACRSPINFSWSSARAQWQTDAFAGRYINVHSTRYPNGHIRGNYELPALLQSNNGMMMNGMNTGMNMNNQFNNNQFNNNQFNNNQFNTGINVNVGGSNSIVLSARNIPFGAAMAVVPDDGYFTVNSVSGNTLTFTITHALFDMKDARFQSSNGQTLSGGVICDVSTGALNSCNSPIRGQMSVATLQQALTSLGGVYVHINSFTRPTGELRGQLTSTQLQQGTFSSGGASTGLNTGSSAYIDPTSGIGSNTMNMGNMMQNMNTMLMTGQVTKMPGIGELTMMSENTRVRTVHLSGAQQVPAPVVTARMAVLTMEYDRQSETVSMTLTHDLADITAAHVHSGLRGAAGQALTTICANSFACKSPVTASMPARRAQWEAMNLEGRYVNVHTSNHPNGELRGQLWFPTRSSSSGVTTNTGNGVNTNTATGVNSNVNNGGNSQMMGGMSMMAQHMMQQHMEVVQMYAPTAQANAFVTTQPLQRQPVNGAVLSYSYNAFAQEFEIEFTHPYTTQQITAAHVHQGLEGQTGGVVATLCDSSVSSGDSCTAGVVVARFGADQFQFTQFRQQGLYVNIHTTMAPNGAARAQLHVPTPGMLHSVSHLTGEMAMASLARQVRDGVAADLLRSAQGQFATLTTATSVMLPTLSVSLSWTQVVDQRGDRNAVGGGNMQLYVDREAELLRYDVTLGRELQGLVTAIHFHRGARGKEGSIVTSLPVCETQSSCAESPISGSARLTSGIRSALAAGSYYVNVHTAAYPEGAIRGQVEFDDVVDAEFALSVDSRNSAASAGAIVSVVVTVTAIVLSLML